MPAELETHAEWLPSLTINVYAEGLDVVLKVRTGSLGSYIMVNSKDPRGSRRSISTRLRGDGRLLAVEHGRWFGGGYDMEGKRRLESPEPLNIRSWEDVIRLVTQHAPDFFKSTVEPAVVC